jgi:hypothetical protein
MTGSNRLCHGGLFAAPSGFARNYGLRLWGARQQTFKEQIPKYCVLKTRNKCAGRNTFFMIEIARIFDVRIITQWAFAQLLE